MEPEDFWTPRLRIDVRGGWEYLGFAKKKLRQMKSRMKDLGLNILRKRFDIGIVDITIQSVRDWDLIRIRSVGGIYIYLAQPEVGALEITVSESDFVLKKAPIAINSTIESHLNMGYDRGCLLTITSNSKLNEHYIQIPPVANAYVPGIENYGNYKWVTYWSPYFGYISELMCIGTDEMYLPYIMPSNELSFRVLEEGESYKYSNSRNKDLILDLELSGRKWSIYNNNIISKYAMRSDLSGNLEYLIADDENWQTINPRTFNATDTVLAIVDADFLYINNIPDDYDTNEIIKHWSVDGFCYDKYHSTYGRSYDWKLYVKDLMVDGGTYINTGSGECHTVYECSEEPNGTPDNTGYGHDDYSGSQEPFVYDYDFISDDNTFIMLYKYKTYDEGDFADVQYSFTECDGYGEMTEESWQYDNTTNYYLAYAINSVLTKVELPIIGRFVQHSPDMSGVVSGEELSRFSCFATSEFLVYTYLYGDAPFTISIDTKRVIGVINVGNPNLAIGYRKEWIVNYDNRGDFFDITHFDYWDNSAIGIHKFGGK
jgi:hypothetical protein